MGSINRLLCVDSLDSSAFDLAVRQLASLLDVDLVAGHNGSLDLPVSLHSRGPEVERALLAVSEELHLDLCWVAAVSTTDSFVYFRVRNGEVVRHLSLAEFEESMWERVEGQPEPWERDAFEGETVVDSDGNEVSLGADGRLPQVGDIGIESAAMDYARAAIQYLQSL